MGRDSIVSITTCRGLEGPGIKCYTWGSPGFQYNVYQLLPGGRVIMAGVDHLPPSSAEVRKKVELYLNSYCGPSWPVQG
jgi:hypothetical protein